MDEIEMILGNEMGDRVAAGVVFDIGCRMESKKELIVWLYSSECEQIQLFPAIALFSF